jgi:hypothetical protein
VSELSDSPRAIRGVELTSSRREGSTAPRVGFLRTWRMPRPGGLVPRVGVPFRWRKRERTLLLSCAIRGLGSQLRPSAAALLTRDPNISLSPAARNEIGGGRLALRVRGGIRRKPSDPEVTSRTKLRIPQTIFPRKKQGRNAKRGRLSSPGSAWFGTDLAPILYPRMSSNAAPPR